MAFFNANVDTTLVNDLDMAYEDMAFGGNFAALIGLMKKESFYGDAKKVPLKDALGAGQGTSAAGALAAATLVQRQAFIVPPLSSIYGTSVIPLNQAAFTNGDNAVIALLMDESKGAMDVCKMQVDQALANTGYGELGTIASHSGGGPTYTLVLSQKSDGNHVIVGTTYASKAAPNSASLDTGTFTVTSKNPTTLTIIVTANSGWAPTDTHVFGQSGTIAASASPVVAPGIPGWIVPASGRPISTSDSFFSVNRSVDEGNLAGLYLDISGTAAGGVQSILDGINTLAFNIADTPGATPDLIVMSFQNKGRIAASLQTQRRYMEGSVKGPDIDVFFKSIKIEGPTGDMDIIGSSNWSSSLVAVLDKSTWVMASPGNKPFAPASVDGNPVQNQPGLDSAVASYRGQIIVYCTAPGRNGMLTVKGS